MKCYKESHYKVQVKIKMESISKIHRYYIPKDEVDFEFDFIVGSSHKFGKIIHKAIGFAMEELKDIPVNWTITSIEIVGKA